MRSLQQIISEMEQILNEVQRYAEDFMSKYESGSLQLPPVKEGEHFQSENIDPKILREFVTKDLETVQDNLAELNRLKSDIAQFMLCFNFGDKLLEDISRHANELISNVLVFFNKSEV